MNSVVIAKFGGSAIGVDGISIPVIIQRINSLSKDAKVVAAVSYTHLTLPTNREV